jgi:hypothetical protein
MTSGSRGTFARDPTRARLRQTPATTAIFHGKKGRVERYHKGEWKAKLIADAEAASRVHEPIALEEWRDARQFWGGE